MRTHPNWRLRCVGSDGVVRVQFQCRPVGWLFQVPLKERAPIFDGKMFHDRFSWGPSWPWRHALRPLPPAIRT